MRGRILFLATRKLVCSLWGAKPAWFCFVVVVHLCLCQALIRHEWSASLPDVGLHSNSSHVAWEQNCAGFCGVHSCLCQALIRHEWGASLADVELHSKSSHIAWEQNRAGLAPQSGQTSLRVARNKTLPHKRHLQEIIMLLFIHLKTGKVLNNHILYSKYKNL